MLVLTTLEHHQEFIPKILKRIEEAKLTLNKEKYIFAKQEIPFQGSLIPKDGIKPDPAKAEALNHAGPPENTEDACYFYA